MRKHFVQELSSVAKFMAGTGRIIKRSAVEANWQLVEGRPGFGKTRSLEWWSVQKNAVYVRARSKWTPNWALKDILGLLGVEPNGNSHSAMYNQVSELLAAKGPDVPLIVDEIEHAFKGDVIELLRDISDVTNTPIVIGGMEGVSRKLKRYQQVYSRIADVTFFGPATEKDAQTLCAELCEVGVEDELAEIVRKRNDGSLRKMMNAIGEVERFGRKLRKDIVTAADMAGHLHVLTNDGAPQ